MKQAQEIADYLRGLGNEQDADYVVFMAESLENDQLHMERLMLERDELRALVERLRDKISYWESKGSACEKGHSCMYRAGLEAVLNCSKETPHQSLAAVRAESVGPAIRTALRNFGNADIDEEDIQHFAEDYAQRIRNGEV